MKNWRPIVVFVVALMAVVVIVGYVLFRRQSPVPREELKTPPAIVATPTVKSTEIKRAENARLLYGKASLCEEEKQILYKPFYGRAVPFNENKSVPQAYRVGMICLKHRLSMPEIEEVQQATTGDIPAPVKSWPGEYVLWVRCGLYKALVFAFDENGRLKKIDTTGTWYKFPPLEAVKPDTSIEPPPMPEIPVRERELFNKIMSGHKTRYPDVTKDKEVGQ